MPEQPDVIVSLVEKGWQAAREYSLRTACDGRRVIHVVKGWLTRDIRQLIGPHDYITVIGIPRDLFWMAVVWHIVRQRVRGRLRQVLVDNERSLRRLGAWARWLKVNVANVP